MAVPSPNISNIYSNTGTKDLIILPDILNGSALFSVKGGSTDVYSIDVQICAGAQRVSIPAYRSKSGDIVGRLPLNCYAVGIDIATNSSGAIIFEISPK